jgi:hypothetical protein
MNSNGYLLKIHAECIPVKGFNRSVICDLNRKKIYPITNDLFDILSANEGKNKSDIFTKFDDEDRQVLTEYIDYLEELECIHWVPPVLYNNFPTLNLEWEYPSLISNAIVDINETHLAKFNEIIKQLNVIQCKNLQIRNFKASKFYVSEKIYNDRYGLGIHSTYNQIQNFLNNKINNMYIFATVRDPQEICISLYFYLIKFINFYKENNNFDFINNDYYLNLCDQSIKNNMGIDWFINQLIENNDFAIRTQYERLDQSVDLYDINDISNHWKSILNHTNINDNTKLQYLNKSNRTNNLILKTDTQNNIKKHFAIDYEIHRF